MTSYPEEERRRFWTEYQPGFRVADPLGAADFYETVEGERYLLEPDILEMANFAAWRDRDVLEAGCGIATDAVQFARSGARYTGIDFSPTAVSHAETRFRAEGLNGKLVQGSILELPFAAESFDLVYSMGVIHHVPETERAVSEFYRVLRPGGRAIVMVYHRDSFNYRFTIMALRRALALLLVVPGADRLLGRVTGEAPDVLLGHRALLQQHGLSYLKDRQLFLNNNTDGPGNPLSKVYSRAQARELFAQFDEVRTAVRFLHLRSYPGGQRLARTELAQRLGRRWGWHLWVDARKEGPAGQPARVAPGA
jgi:ubiquinone/menaquinone biosynthesis C-methylase UbiE